MIRKLAVSLALLTSTAAVAEEAQTPVNTPPAAALKGAKKLPPQWETTAREIYNTAVETPTVKGRAGENLKLATYLAGKLKIDQLVTRRYGLDEANEAFRALAAGELARGLIVF